MIAPNRAGRVIHQPRPGAAVVVDRVSKVFGYGGKAVLALHELSLTVRPGEMVCLVGVSGSGKSTLLNLLAGLDEPSAGTIDIGGAGVALMFQEAALMPWLSGQGNVELPLRLRRLSSRDAAQEARRLLRLVGLERFAERFPHELSGGMRQRVALARALAQDAALLLMDEPFGALDSATRDLLHDELESIWKDRRMTVVFVTHNNREAVRLGDRVLLLSSQPGRVLGEFPVDLPRPRRLESAELGAVAAEIGDRLGSEVRPLG